MAGKIFINYRRQDFNRHRRPAARPFGAGIGPNNLFVDVVGADLKARCIFYS